MKKTGDLMAANGSYTNAEGEEKTRWIKVGALFQRDDGRMSIKLEALPVGEFNGWLSVFEPREKQPNQQTQQHNDPIPF